MSSIDEIRETRLQKLKKLQDAGINPYPAHANQDFELSAVIANFSKLSKSKKNKYSLVGRIMSLRPQGGLVFFHFSDGTGKLQAMLKKGEGITDKDFDLFVDTMDVGDFVEVSGTLFETKRKEKTIEVQTWKILAKSLRPLPEKWHGLQDIEERFRKRYLDTLMNDEVKARFLLRSKIVKLIRQFYDDNGFVEVEVPTLQPLAGGATAEPFETHHNALDTDFYLTIAQELYLKELLAGGFNKVYEIGKRFRNEGIDTFHNPEFTMLESNEAYADAKSQRDFIEKLFKFVVKSIFGSFTFEFDGKKINFKSRICDTC
jgi:lysyl-tRNA synthetase class 2